MGITTKALPEEVDLALALIRQGHSNASVGLALKRSCTWVRMLRKQAGISPLPRGNPPSIPPKIYAKAIKLVHKRVPSAQVAAQLNIPLPVVYYMAYKRNLLAS